MIQTVVSGIFHPCFDVALGAAGDRQRIWFQLTGYKVAAGPPWATVSCSISLPLRQGGSSLTILYHSNRVVNQQMYDPKANGIAGGRF